MASAPARIRRSARPGCSVLRFSFLILAIFSGCAGREAPSPGTGKCPVLAKFLASWCDTCTIEMTAFRAALDRLPDASRPQILVVAVLDSSSSLEAYRKASHLPFRIVHDESGALQTKFSLSAIPATGLLGPGGEALPFIDPFTGERVTLLAGPRDWSDPRAATFLAHLCDPPLLP